MAKVRLYGDTSGYVDLKAPDVAGDVTITLPNTTGPFATETYVDSAVAALSLGKVLQVVSTTKTDLFSASVATTAESSDVTGLTVSITPQSVSNKIYISYNMSVGLNATVEGIYTSLYRNGSILSAAVGNSSSGNFTVSTNAAVHLNYVASSHSFSFLDSPNSTSSQTYSIRLRHQSPITQTVYVNGPSTGSRQGRTASTITAIEVAA